MVDNMKLTLPDMFNRQFQGVITDPTVPSSPPFGNDPANYTDFGLGVGSAKEAQAVAETQGKIHTYPWFTARQLGQALWFTTRTILTPLGHVE
jgi:hypothetical protein